MSTYSEHGLLAIYNVIGLHRTLTDALATCDVQSLQNWKLDRRKVESFLAAAEQAYGHANSYHNSTHAADVVQAAFIMLRSVQQPQFTKLEVRREGCDRPSAGWIANF